MNSRILFKEQYSLLGIPIYSYERNRHARGDLVVYTTSPPLSVGMVDAIQDRMADVRSMLHSSFVGVVSLTEIAKNIINKRDSGFRIGHVASPDVVYVGFVAIIREGDRFHFPGPADCLLQVLNEFEQVNQPLVKWGKATSIQYDHYNDVGRLYASEVIETEDLIKLIQKIHHPPEGNWAIFFSEHEQARNTYYPDDKFLPTDVLSTFGPDVDVINTPGNDNDRLVGIHQAVARYRFLVDHFGENTSMVRNALRDALEFEQVPLSELRILSSRESTVSDGSSTCGKRRRSEQE